MRRLRRKFRKNQSKIILTTAFALVFCLCVGYAAFQTVINFNVKGNIKKKLLTPRDLTKNVVTTGDGLYADTTEEGRYIYRGANPNNYIKLGSDMYSIIAVESDNTLKVIKNGSIGRKAFDPGYATVIDGVTSANSSLGTRYSSASTDYCFDYDPTEYYGCNVWGSKTTMLDTNGNNVTQMPREVGGTLYNLPDKEASLNTYLNNDWYNSLDSSVKSKIVTHMFNVGAVNVDETNLSNTITQEATYKWKGKVGLMLLSEYVKASTNLLCDSVSSYYNNSSCYNNSETHNWIFASIGDSDPLMFAHRGIYTVFFVLHYGFPSFSQACDPFGIAPVFYLSSDITLSGEGTSDNPYTVG